MRLNKSLKPEAVCSTDSMRDAINAPHLRGGFLRATNGRVLAVMPIERDPKDVDGFVPLPAIVTARKAARKKYRFVEAPTELTIALTPKAAVVRDEGDMIVCRRPLEDKFPKGTDDLFPVGETIDVGIDAALLLGLVKALGSKGRCVLRFRKDDAGQMVTNAPVEVEALEAEAEGFGVIMPVRLDAAHDPKPWRKAYKETTV